MRCLELRWGRSAKLSRISLVVNLAVAETESLAIAYDVELRERLSRPSSRIDAGVDYPNLPIDEIGGSMGNIKLEQAKRDTKTSADAKKEKEFPEDKAPARWDLGAIKANGSLTGQPIRRLKEGRRKGGCPRRKHFLWARGEFESYLTPRRPSSARFRKLVSRPIKSKSLTSHVCMSSDTILRNKTGMYRRWPRYHIHLKQSV